jgi:MoaA/NifB/PqqE/SkfB family radical SAM enzyme
LTLQTYTGAPTACGNHRKLLKKPVWENHGILDFIGEFEKGKRNQGIYI